MATNARGWRIFAAFALGVFGCAAEDSAPATGDGAVGSGGAFSGAEPPASGGAPANGTGGTRPAEVENESAYLAPVATGKYLWTANPLSGRVALIDATTLAVTLDTAGDGPTQVLGLPELDGRYGALILNERSDDATLFRVAPDGTLTRGQRLTTHADANAWALSPSGRFAIAWTDARRRVDPDPLQTFQDITLLELAPGRERAWPLSVGPRPRAFAFDAAEEHAYVVTEEGISVIELGAEPAVDTLIAVSDEPFASATHADVSFAPDGSYAVVRNEGESVVRVIALPDGDVSSVELGSTVTDVDLAPDGSRAYAVLGSVPAVVTLPLPLPSLDAAELPRLALPSEQIGSIALNADASAALLYTTALAEPRVLVLDLGGSSIASASYRPQSVITAVTAVFPSPNPAYVVAFQSPAAGSSKAGAFSVLSLLARRSPKIVATDASLSQIAFSPAGDTALVTVSSAERAAFGAYLIHLARQEVNFIALESPPLSAGVVPDAKRAYIAQGHPEGRITFVSLSGGALQTITGFELSARIRE